MKLRIPIIIIIIIIIIYSLNYSRIKPGNVRLYHTGGLFENAFSEIESESIFNAL